MASEQVAGSPLAVVLLLLGALGALLVAGVFYAFSGFVLAGLRESGPSHAVAAMQGINLTAVRPPLMIALFGTPLCLLIATGTLVATAGWSSATWLGLASLALYVAGVVAITAAGNVPLNNRLAAVGEDVDGGWDRFERPWRRFNSVRTVAAALAGAAALGAAYLIAS